MTVIALDSRRVSKGAPGTVVDGKGNVVVCLTSGAALLTGRDWSGVIMWDELKRRIVLRSQMPGREAIVAGAVERAWTEADTLAAVQWLEECTGKRWPTSLVHECVLSVAMRPGNRYDPIRTYLDSIRGKWTLSPDTDGRIEEGPANTWLTDYLGVEDSPYVRSVGRYWLVSCVARALKPGCKVDTTMVLEGNQGHGKSRALRTLCPNPDWYSDTRIEIGTKDALQQLEGVWIYEVGELDAFRGKAETQIKAFLTSQVDSYRPAYGRSKQDYPRRCAFAGTTNEEHWLEDRTGGRRYWPVRCTGEIRVAALEEARDELWAHALALYESGRDWWPVDAAEKQLFSEQQAERQSEDTWSDAITRWHAQGRPVPNDDDTFTRIPEHEVTTEHILRGACKVPIERHDARAVKRVSGLLRLLGWTQERVMERGVRSRRWRPPERVREDDGQEELGF